MKRSIVGWSLGGLALILFALQLIPVPQTNPPVTADLVAPADVKAVLRRSCYDCHSNETVWPGYSRIAPGSFLIAQDVKEGREVLNFSDWGNLPAERQAEAIGESIEEIHEGEMPPWYYLLLHPKARLSEADRKILDDWKPLSASRG